MNTVYTPSKELNQATKQATHILSETESYETSAQSLALVSIARSLEQIAAATSAPQPTQTKRDVRDAQVNDLLTNLDRLARDYANNEYGLPIKDSTCMICMRSIVARWLAEVQA